MSRRPIEPFLWALFAGGGAVAAMLIPVHLFLFGLAIPLGWLPGPDYWCLLALATTPLTRIYLFVVCTLPVFHAAHRFRYTLYDGLQIKHLNEVINIFCYGGALATTLITAYLLWNLG